MQALLQFKTTNLGWNNLSSQPGFLSLKEAGKWLYGDCLEEIREGVKCKASHKQTNKKPVSNGICEPYRKTADKISVHPDNPKSATLKTEKNDRNNISFLGT